MEQNKNNETKDQIYASDLLKILADKLKLILIIGLIAAIIGGSVGVLLAVMNTEYTAEINISVSPMDSTDKLLFNIRSGRFAEALLFEENGLPAKDKCNAQDYEEAVKAMETFEAAREKKYNKYLEMTRYHITDVESAYKRLVAEYTEALEILKMYKEADGEAFVNNEEHLKMIALWEENLLTIQAKKKAYYEEVYLPAEEQRVKLEAEYEVLCDEVSATRKAADEAIEKVLETWRKRPEVREDVEKIKNSVTYNYFEFELPADSAAVKEAEPQDEVELRKGYIRGELKVSIKDKAFAEELIEAYNTHFCSFVKKQVEDITGYADVECLLIDPIITLERTTGLSMYAVETIKFALVASVAVGALTYIVCVCKMLVTKNKKDHSAE